MNPEQSHQLVKQTFQADFDRQKFVEFIDKLLKKVDFKKQFMQSGLNIRRAFIDKVNSFERVGQFTDSDGKKIDILIVNLKKDLTLERGRTGLRNFAADYLQSDRGVGKSAVLIAYVSNTQTDWRFSYVTLEKDLKQNEKGTFKEEITKLTPARRYSFLVGKYENSHTAQRQFFELLNNAAPKLQSVEDAFNIEKVTKEFFAEYKLLFEKVRNELDKLCKKNKGVRDELVGKGMFAYVKDEDGNELLDRSGNRIKEPFTDDFAKKLLGQIVFLYFLQKKGWFGVGRNNQWGTGDKNFLRTLFSENATKSNFFDSVLEPLFYNALAVKRQHDWSDRFNCKIPFLNGGLFEPLNDYDWVHIELQMPNGLFSNSEVSQQGDKGTGILDVFDRYNFTINEAEPLEVEVAVDPEMLGKIFENLLPENIRHGSGTYYTPRVIVAYMCQQSLTNYLASQLSEIPREDIETFIRFGSQQRDYTEAGTQAQADKFLPHTIIENAVNVDRHLAEITVCDPAIGSGAFPVGMMLEIVKAREALQSVEEIGQVSQYELKRQTIENSLYGVDIDAGAVEIAKLRLWLSLIVDEADFKRIEPLPNLDYKIMQGNSLLDEFRGVKLIDEKLFEQKQFDKESRLAEIEAEVANLSKELGRSNVGKQSPLYVLTNKRIAELKKEKAALSDESFNAIQAGLFVPLDDSHKKLEDLKRKHKEIFDETRKDIKEQLRKEAEKLEWEFIEAKLRADGKTDKLAELESHRNDRRKDYFLWQLNFPEVFQKGGFDIVIGNPPYLRLQGLQQTQPEFVPRYIANYVSAKGNFDIYAVFIERGYKLLSPHGQFSFIVPHKFFNASFGSSLRKLLGEKRAINHIVRFGSEQVFENPTTYTCLLFLSALPNEKFRFADVYSLDNPTAVMNTVASNLESEAVAKAILRVPEGEQKWEFQVGGKAKVLEKLRQQRITLGDITRKIFVGLQTSADKIYVLRIIEWKSRHVKCFSKSLNKEILIEKNIVKPFLMGKNVHRYQLPEVENVVIFPYTIKNDKATLMSQQFIRETFPLAWSYLLANKPILEGRERGKMKHHGFYAYIYPKNLAEFDAVKIMTPEIAYGSQMSIDENGELYHTTKIYSFVFNQGVAEPMKYFLGVLNSKVLWFFLKSTGYVLRGGYFTFKTEYLKPFPIPCSLSANPPLLKHSIEIEGLVNEILNLKKTNSESDTSKLEDAIDRRVYRLYGLSDDEIAIIESEV